MFERMEIAGYIYKGVVEPSYKNPTRAESNHDGHSSQKRGEAASSQTHYKIGESSVKRRKQYLDRLSGESKTCLIHSSRHSSGESKILGDFGAQLAQRKPTKYRGDHIVPRKKFNRQQENNAIVNNMVDEILLNETWKVSAAKEAPEFWDSDYDYTDLYEVESMSLEDTKEKVQWRKCAYYCKHKRSYWI